MAVELPELLCEDAAAWSAWLQQHATDATGIWLVLAKKGVTAPTTLTYPEAVDEAVCHGWIDGQARSRDARTYSQRFTPRRAHSNWSPSNVARVVRLEREGRMRVAGLREVERAKADGRWDRAGGAPGIAATD